jgi:hypothetical protein
MARLVFSSSPRSVGQVRLTCDVQTGLSTEWRKDQLRATITESSIKEDHRLTCCQASAVQSGSPPRDVRHGLHRIIKAVQEISQGVYAGPEKKNNSTDQLLVQVKSKEAKLYASVICYYLNQ